MVSIVQLDSEKNIYKVEYDNGDYYIGALSEEKKEGFGKYCFKNGAIYEGYRKNNQRNGYGIYYNQTGERKDCVWINGKPDLEWDLSEHDFDLKGWCVSGLNIYTGSFFDGWGYDKNGYDRYGYDGEGFDKNYFDKNGNVRFDKRIEINSYKGKAINVKKYNKKGFNRNGYNILTDSMYDKMGFDIYGYDKDGFDIYGMNNNGEFIDGVYRSEEEKKEYIWGFKFGRVINKYGFNLGTRLYEGGNSLSKYDKNGFLINGIHKDTNDIYNLEGFDRDGIHKNTGTLYNENGYDMHGNRENDNRL